MTLTQLEHVLQAFKAGSFTRAARACGVTQAALSNSIARLEEELGGRIFSRTTHRVRLSAFGETLLPYVEQILGGREALVGAAKAQQASSTTIIGHSPLIPSRVLTQIIGAVRDARFGTELRLVEENLYDLLQRLAEHTVDIAIVPEGDYGSSIRSAPVFQEALYYVPRHGLKPEGDEVTLKSLGADTFVMVPDRCGLARRTRALFASARVPLKVYAGEALGYHVMQEWAALDLGSAILPRSQLTDGTRALAITHAPGNAVTITYRVAWHREYERGKQLAVLLQRFRLPHEPTAGGRAASRGSRRRRGTP